MPAATAHRASGDTVTRTIPFIVERHSFGTKRNASLAAIEVKKQKANDPDADKSLLSLRKRLLNCDELQAINNLDNNFRKDLLAISATPFKPGLYLIPLGLAERTYARAETWERERDTLADKAAEKYPRLIAPMEKLLGPLFNRRDYPPAQVFRAAFWVSFRFIDMGVPNILKEIRADVFAKEREKMQEEAQRATDMVRQHLRGTLLEITNHLGELLTPKANGRMPALREGALDRLVGFLDTLELRDVTNDTELRAVVQRLRKAAGNSLDLEVLRDDHQLRDRTREVMEDAKKTLAGLVQETGRAIRLRDEEEVGV